MYFNQYNTPMLIILIIVFFGALLWWAYYMFVVRKSPFYIRKKGSDQSLDQIQKKMTEIRGSVRRIAL